jgi:hypothetical protein
MALDQRGLPKIDEAYKERLSRGLEAEMLVYEYMSSFFGSKVKHRSMNSNDPNARLDNFKYGDIEFHYDDDRKFFFDVKCGTFITETSAKGGFKGQYYILLPKGDTSPEAIKDAHVVKSSTVHSYANKISNSKWKEGPSDRKGYRFGRIKNFMRLEDFCVKMAKTYLNTNEFVSPLIVLSRQFNKVLPEGGDEKFRAK